MHMPSSPATECQISGLYSFSVEDCVELLQPTAINCSGILMIPRWLIDPLTTPSMGSFLVSVRHCM